MFRKQLHLTGNVQHVGQLVRHFNDCNNKVRSGIQYTRNPQNNSVDYRSYDNFVDFGINQIAEKEDIQRGAKESEQTFQLLFAVRRKYFPFLYLTVCGFVRGGIFERRRLRNRVGQHIFVKILSPGSHTRFINRRIGVFGKLI
ncbi:uncharacterized protein LOC111615023 [Centruroides sculpturatus]|uniref:uncharacterized protein LOC111615023 n=1 Tax=Centruroides sculpturatus TaxID=218467 RepID=UPI000C6DEA43|nr:uncharacterized protein LOC111615023 [Centruroides sculpturatus]